MLKPTRAFAIVVVTLLVLGPVACGGEPLVPLDGLAPPSVSSDDDPPPDNPPPDHPPPDAPPPDEPPPDEPPANDCYSEPIFPAADIDAQVSSYGGGGWQQELIDIMDERHPATGALLDAQRQDSYFFQFSDSSSWSGMVGWLDTLSHEETHLFNAYEAMDRGAHHVLFLRGDLILELPEPPDDMARNRIYDVLDSEARNGIYAPTYLTGEQGSRGMVAVLDETSCYLNEIGALGSVGEHYPGYGVSLRDGTWAFLYFVTEYLAVMRAEEASTWQALHGEPAYRDAVQLLWQRTHFLMPFAEAHANLGIDDDMYRALAHDQARMEEVSLFIDATVGDSPCVTPR